MYVSVCMFGSVGCEQLPCGIHELAIDIKKLSQIRAASLSLQCFRKMLLDICGADQAENPV